jgi:4-hydroxybenzoate polyprenyltransferase
MAAIGGGIVLTLCALFFLGYMLHRIGWAILHVLVIWVIAYDQFRKAEKTNPN